MGHPAFREAAAGAVKVGVVEFADRGIQVLVVNEAATPRVAGEVMDALMPTDDSQDCLFYGILREDGAYGKVRDRNSMYLVPTYE